LAGERIPLSARILALADVYDALTSQRVYKSAFTHEKAMGIITEGRGSHFDPTVVDAFVACQAAFEKTAAELKDDVPAPHLLE
jgi:HD-GYP domain-containing protein (c-di-GMP phosphodiesterase class II)